MREEEDRGGRGRVKEEVVVVTWSFQGMSMGERGKRKVRAVAEFARKQGWDVVLLSEDRGCEEGAGGEVGKVEGGEKGA